MPQNKRPNPDTIDLDTFNPDQALEELREASRNLPTVPNRGRRVGDRQITQIATVDVAELDESLTNFFASINQSDFGSFGINESSRPAIITYGTIPPFENDATPYITNVEVSTSELSIGEMTAFLLSSGTLTPLTRVTVEARPSAEIVDRIFREITNYTRQEMLLGSFLISYRNYINILRAYGLTANASAGRLYMRDASGYDVGIVPAMVNDDSVVFSPHYEDLVRIHARSR